MPVTNCIDKALSRTAYTGHLDSVHSGEKEIVFFDKLWGDASAKPKAATKAAGGARTQAVTQVWRQVSQVSGAFVYVLLLRFGYTAGLTACCFYIEFLYTLHS